MGIKKALFFLLDNYADWEGAFLASRLNASKGWTVETASLEKGICKSIGGFTTMIEHSIEALPRHVDLFVLIGGNSWNIESSKLNKLISTYLNDRVVVAAICGAVDFLARGGMLNDYKHTGNSPYLWRGYNKYRNTDNFILKQVVVDRNLITANGTACIELSENVLKNIDFETLDIIKKDHELFRLGYYNYLLQYEEDPFK
ncbi:transcriptional regulator [Photorhabdus khanii NC19]|uniref:Transcriptional regulator n=1 Tax=Photorhabdus khanii NC19 TaxID=1004151 RepID=W3V8U8_9GAMM|nr:DJ-1/PfpI family protein [Photorhabdus khanii]ETS32238.1 transcriptional regulator [Photorhabdus khanii NC19]